MQPEKIFERYRLKPLIMTFALFFLIAVSGSIFTPTRLITLLSIMLGLFCYLILPGYFLLLNIELDDIERIILSTAIGIALIPIILFVLNLFYIKITFWLIILIIFLIMFIGIFLKEKEYIFKSRKSK
jgi:uncharacterized membrane protein